MAKFIKTASPMGQEHSFLKVLHNGFSGSGKTTAMSKAAMPFIIEPSPQAMVSIRAANDRDAIVFEPEGIKDLYEVVKMLRAAKPEKIDGLPALIGNWGGEEFAFQSIVVDDLEEIMSIFKADIQGRSDTLDLRGWGVMNDRVQNFLRALRNIACNFHLGVKVLNTTDGDQIVHDFAIQGKSLKPVLPGLCNAMCYHYRRQPDEDPREFLAAFRLPDKFRTKAHPALKDVEDPDPKMWWGKVRSWAGGLDAQEGGTDHLMPQEARRGVQDRRRAQQKSQQHPQRNQQRQQQNQQRHGGDEFGTGGSSPQNNQRQAQQGNQGKPSAQERSKRMGR